LLSISTRIFYCYSIRSISGPTREEVAGGWRRLHNEELHNLYVLSNIIMVFESRMIWEDNIKTDIRVIRWEGVDWMRLVQDRDQ
jgi:hypothetical protein